MDRTKELTLYGFEFSKNLEVGDLVTLRKTKVIKWSKGQKVYGVYNGGNNIIVYGIANINKTQCDELMGEGGLVIC